MTVNGLKPKLLNVVSPRFNIGASTFYFIYEQYLQCIRVADLDLMYVDDTSVQISRNYITYLVSSLNVKLELLYKWFNIYILSFCSLFSDRVGLPLHDTPFPGVLMKSIGAALDVLLDVNHMRGMQYVLCI